MDDIHQKKTARRVILGVSGASGVEYAFHLARALRAADGVELHGIISGGAREVLRHESSIPL